MVLIYQRHLKPFHRKMLKVSQLQNREVLCKIQKKQLLKQLVQPRNPEIENLKVHVKTDHKLLQLKILKKLKEKKNLHLKPLKHLLKELKEL